MRVTVLLFQKSQLTCTLAGGMHPDAVRAVLSKK